MKGSHGSLENSTFKKQTFLPGGGAPKPSEVKSRLIIRLVSKRSGIVCEVLHMLPALQNTVKMDKGRVHILGFVLI